MRIRRLLSVVAIAVCWWGGASVAGALEECTSAVISPAASLDGVPILWKNRDTDSLSNKVVFVREAPHSYLGLANAASGSGRSCFAGLNSAGFAIMNTVATNLPMKGGEMHDLEGMMMADALRTCATVNDFARYLDANLGPDLGSQANFGVIDAAGRAVLFEVHNHGYTAIDAAAAPPHYLVNTNFARTGSEGEGHGYLRFERACELFRDFADGKVDFRRILTRFTRDIGHALLRHPGLNSLATQPADRPRWIDTRDCIDRPSTAAAVVFVGRDPAVAGSVATMWVVPGEPLTAIAVPLWVEAGSSPEALWRGEEAPMWQESLRIKRLIRPNVEGGKESYVELTRLDNAAGTGFLPDLLAVESEIVKSTEEFIGTQRSGEELAELQNRMAVRALEALRSVR